ncbi:MAG: DUF3945 domain-containing protein, partial [Muribaculaceae bacterium]|nr:DUF3945 domain-containing protein [Muribaculaceae bacterium]
QNPDGTPKMADAKTAKLSDLVKFTKGQNPLEAFMSNFIRQVKNPSRFGFFKIPEDQYEKVGPVMADLLQDPKANAELLKPVEVDVKAMAQEQSQEQKADGQQKKPVEQQEQTKKETSTAIRMAPVDPNKIDWDTIEKQWGIKRDDLEKSGAMQQMVYNHKSPQLFTVTPDIGGEKFEAQARLSFKMNPDGSYTLSPHFVKHEPQLDQTYKGYTFTDEDKAQLRKTGNLGKAVDLTDPKTGEVKKSLISIDRLTNEIESIPVEKVYIKSKIANVELDMKQIGILKDGGVVREQHIELPNGRKFTADLQYNADKRDVTFVNSEQYRQRREQSQEQVGQQMNSWLDKEGNIKNLTKWKGVPLSETAQAEYRSGKQILVGEIPDKKGNPCTVYLQFDPDKQRPKQTYVYPDRDKVVGIASESKTQYAVNNQGKTNETTKGIKEPLQRGQTEPKNEAQKQQTKPKGPKL